MSKVLPYVNGLVIAIGRLISAVAAAAGYELPDYTDSDIYTDVTGDIEGIGDAADDSAEQVEKLHKALAPFDKLNILSEKSSGTSSSVIGGGYPVLDEAIAKKTESYFDKFNTELSGMKDKAKEVADAISEKVEGFMDVMDKISPVLKGVATSVGAYAIINFFVGLATKIGDLSLTPAGVIAIAIGAVVALIAAVDKYKEHIKEKDLEARFGVITLSDSEIEEIAKQITEGKYTANLDIYLKAKTDLGDIEKDIEDDLETLNKLNWKVDVGLGLTEGEVEQYKSVIEQFITDSESYIEQQHYVTDLAINAVITADDGGDFKQEITELVDSYFSSSSGEMTRLGTQLRDAMDEALADGILDAHEKETVTNLVKEITDIQSQVADAQFVAKIQSIEFEGDLTPESYKKLFDEIQEQITERSKTAKDAEVQLLTVVNADYEIKMKNATTDEQKREIQKQYNEDVTEIQSNFNNTKIQITKMGLEFALDQLQEHWQPEYDSLTTKVQGGTQAVIQSAIDGGLDGVDSTEKTQSLMSRLHGTFESAWKNSGITGAAADNLKEYLEQWKPSDDQNKEMAQWYTDTGQVIPDALSASLTDYANIAMLTGDIDSMYYIMGQQLAESPEIQKMLANGELTASDLDDSIIAGMKSKLPDLKTTAEGLLTSKNGVKGGFKKGTTTVKTDVHDYAISLINGYNSAYTEDRSTVSAVESWLTGITTTVNNWKIPSVKVGVEFEVGDIPTIITKGGGVLQQYATGGFPNTGEMFMARENGIPELVGRVGNNTAVANNSQIEAGIEEAAYRGYIRAITENRGSNNSDTGDIVVTIDGKEVFRAMRRQANQYYDMTKKSPFPV